MEGKERIHHFHIPVMGTGYTIDTPLKVAQYGIDSVISIIDHRLTENMREVHSKNSGYPFTSIPETDEDCRAKRITAYLNLVDDIVSDKFEALKNSPFDPGSEITRYFDMLAESSDLKKEYRMMLEAEGDKKLEIQQHLREAIRPGAIDVNIMTKVDRVNYSKETKEALPVEYNDAHAAMRGFANSKLSSSIVLSAGLNPRLYSYMANFKDFYPDENGALKKKIIVKVSDYRSALIQGKFLAKKGMWVSEFRIESGLNCGGHAFATDGYLLCPILQEFKEHRSELEDTLFEMYSRALDGQGKAVMNQPPYIAVTVQGGVGTFEEQEFLIDQYGVDSVGWGSPFLLVPEVVNIDGNTMSMLSEAQEEQLFLSDMSPLGIPFNTLKDASIDIEKQNKIETGKPGAACLKKYLALNSEYTEKTICTASRQYQRKKIGLLEKEGLPVQEFKEAVSQIVVKACLCLGLANSALKNSGVENTGDIKGVAVCPGPNIAYFSKIVSLKEMADHIYGRINIITRSDRPSMFVKELNMYIEYLQKKIDDGKGQFNDAQLKYFNTFQENLNHGIDYYNELFSSFCHQFEEAKENILTDFDKLREELDKINPLKNFKIPQLQH